ncbi:MAG: Gfo/Idh/MocA family protein [Planctomycetota bacterium]|jgi:predicted dehydrogenase
MNKSTIRIGLLGAGAIAKIHANVYVGLEGVEVTGVAMCTHEELPELKRIAPEVVYYPNEADLFRSAEIDVVDICLPTFLHVSKALEAMKAGKPVICEKPLALSVEEAKKVQEAQRETGVLFYVAHVIRFWPQYKYLYDVVKSNKYGPLRSASFVRMTAPPDWSRNGWMVDQKRSGGAIFDVHIHDIDFVNHLLGRPKGLQSLYPEARNHIFSILQYPKDLSVTVEGGTILPPHPNFFMCYSAVFEQALLTFNTLEGDQVGLYLDGKTEMIECGGPKYEDKLDFFVSGGEGYYYELKHFTDCIKLSQPSDIITVESVIQTLEIIEWEVNEGAK